MVIFTLEKCDVLNLQACCELNNIPKACGISETVKIILMQDFQEPSDGFLHRKSVERISGFGTLHI